MNLHCLSGDLLLLLGIEKRRVRRLCVRSASDRDHADIFGHGDKHFPQGFRLLLLLGCKNQAGSTWSPVTGSGLFTEGFYNILQGHRGILDHVMQEAGYDRWSDQGPDPRDLMATPGDG